jgi:hypothetical protein
MKTMVVSAPTAWVKHAYDDPDRDCRSNVSVYSFFASLSSLLSISISILGILCLILLSL